MQTSYSIDSIIDNKGDKIDKLKHSVNKPQFALKLDTGCNTIDIKYHYLSKNISN